MVLTTKPNLMDFSANGINNILEGIKVRNLSTKPPIISNITLPKLLPNDSNDVEKKKTMTTTTILGTKRCRDNNTGYEKQGSTMMKKKKCMMLDYETSMNLYKQGENYQRPTTKVVNNNNNNNSNARPRKSTSTPSVSVNNKLSKVTVRKNNPTTNLANIGTGRCHYKKLQRKINNASKVVDNSGAMLQPIVSKNREVEAEVVVTQSTCKGPSNSRSSSSEESSSLEYEGCVTSVQQASSSPVILDEPQTSRGAMLRARYAGIISKSRKELERIEDEKKSRGADKKSYC